jgi:cytochrome c553
MMKTISTLLVAAALACAGGAHAADLAAGRAKAKEVCEACHGMDGLSAANAEYPKLAGQHRDYLAKALRDYKSGVRKNPIMGAMAQPLTAADIDNMSAYYASQPGPLKSLY